MKKLTTTLGLASLLALAGCSVKITGHWDQELPGLFRADTELEPGENYTIENDTDETITVWLLNDRTPLAYFPVLPRESYEFTAPGESFDLFTRGEQTIEGLSLWWIPSGF